MPTEDLRSHAEEVVSLLGSDTKTPVNADDIQAQLERFLEYGVPLNQAKQSLLKKYGTSPGIATQAMERTKIKELQTHMRSVKILAQIVSINTKEITVKGESRQILYGILRDETGSVSFTSWHDIGVQRDDIVEIGNAYTNEWQGSVQLNIGNRTTVEKKEKDALPKEMFEPTKCTIQEIRPGMGSLDIKVLILEIEKKVVEVDGNSKTMFTGVFGDKTGKVPFTSWHDFKLKQKDTLSLVGGYVRSWKGVPQITFDENAKIMKIKKEGFSISDVPEKKLRMFQIEEQGGLFDVSVEGRVIEIQQGSGFIFRCPECNRMIEDGTCRDHGLIDGVADLRIRCTIDDGSGSVSAIFNRQLSEEILEKSIDDCKEMSPDSLMNDIKEKVYAQIFMIQGNTRRDRFGITFIPSKISRVHIDIPKEADQITHLLDEGGFIE